MKTYYHNFAEAVWKVSKAGYFEPVVFLATQTMELTYNFNYIKKKFESMYPLEDIQNGYLKIAWVGNRNLTEDLKTIIMRMEISITGHMKDEEKMDLGIKEFLDYDLPIYLVEMKFDRSQIGGMSTNH